MKKILIILILVIGYTSSFSQTSATEENLLIKGTSALAEGKLEEAVAALQECITSEEKNKPHCLTTMGEVYELQNKPEAAIEAYKKALAIFTSLANEQEIAAISSKLGDLHLKPTTFYRALEYYQKSKSLAEKNSYQEILTHSLRGLADVYEKLYLYKEALSYRKQYEAELQKLNNEEKRNEIEELAARYESTISDKEKMLLARETKIKNLEKKSLNFKYSPESELLIPFSVGLLALLAVGLVWKSRKPAKIVKKPIPVATPVQIPEVDQKRIESFKNIHENLRTGFAKINHLNEQIYLKTTHLPDVKYNSLIVKETTKKMLESSWDLIWALNPESTTITSLILRMKEFAEDYLDESHIEPIFHIPEQLPHISISKDTHSEIYLVVKEALTNVANHSAASKVFFTVNLHSNIFLVTVIDNGNGFVLTNPTNGKGLTTMKERLDKLNATLEITSKIGQGTMISISVLLDRKV